ncbi:hypothetical protein [Lactococcus lactis]|uniref:hypothetical protein n=1 Tax=Lactococcus lactis TaxID=1358 RepID=UPI0021A2686B|nr:hypothetical protein [Lactococcus lactis]MCT3125965.1 hypothetical protein [Lactococcus lactis]
MAEEIVKRDGVRNPYSIIPNELVQNENITWAARGLMVYILSMPEDWVFYKTEVMKHGEKKRDAFNKIWMELQRFGYISKENIRDENGRFTSETKTFKGKDGIEREVTFGVVWTIHEQPIKVEEPKLIEEVIETEAIEEKIISEVSEGVKQIFERSFDTIDSFDDELIPEEDKELIKSEFESELMDMIEPSETNRFFQIAWEEATDNCKNDNFFAQYLVNNMQKQAKIFRLAKAKIKIESLKSTTDFGIPFDGPWNK